MRLTRFKRALIVVLAGGVIVALASAALSDDDAPAYTVALNPSREDSTSPPPEVVVANVRLPGGASPGSALVLVQGMVERRLMYWPLVGTMPPREIDHHVRSWPLLADPGGRRVFYATETTAMVFDAQARRSVIVGEFQPDDVIWAVQWSPDGTALAYVVVTENDMVAYYARADGSRPARQMIAVRTGLHLDVAWLPDGRPVAIYLGVGELGGLEPRYEVYNPGIGEMMPLPDDAAWVQTWQPWRSPDGRWSVYSMRAWEETTYRLGCLSGPLGLSDARWLDMASAGEPVTGKSSDHTAFEIPGVYLDRPTWLQDGRIVFRGRADGSCTDAATGLYVAAVGEEPVLLAEAGTPYQADEQTGKTTYWAVSYHLSPDETLVAWVDNDEFTRTSRVRLTSLVTGVTTTLYSTPFRLSGPAFFYQDEQMILHFTWLP